MIGTVEFNASTLYRYATLDANLLAKNLGDREATRTAVEVFLQAFATSMPTGKQNTFANRTLPDAVVISIRDTQPVNLVGAFEEAVYEQPRVATASARLAARAQTIDAAYDTTPVKTWVVRSTEAAAALDALSAPEAPVSLRDAITQVGALVAGRLHAEA